MIGEILRDVAKLHGVTVREIRSRRRLQKHVAARHAAIWILRQVDSSLSEQRIAQAVGLTNHTSVIHALRKVDELVGSDHVYAEALHQIVARHRGTSIALGAEPPQRLPGSPDRWAIANARAFGVPFVKSA
jgi:hypothetical protein